MYEAAINKDFGSPFILIKKSFWNTPRNVLWRLAVDQKMS